ncbi:MAG: hypothetical protein C4339_02675 [Nitrososphaerota archaeon]
MEERPYNAFAFYGLRRSWFLLPPATRYELGLSSLQAFLKQGDVAIDLYSTLGLKAGVDFMAWLRAHSPEQLQRAFASLRGTSLAQHIACRHLFFGIALPSPYTGRISAGAPSGLPYLTLYPFSKTAEWYQLPFEVRRQLMEQEHVEIASKFKGIRQFLYYSYGLGDDEFIVAYEMKSLPEYVALVMALRSSKVRPYTLRDTPIFTCVRASPEELSRLLAGLEGQS